MDDELVSFATVRGNPCAGTLTAISRREDRCTLHVMYPDRTEGFALAGPASIRFRNHSDSV
jgi:hypothetical protein